MSKNGWTPGPWETVDDEQRIDGIGTVKMERVVDKGGVVVAEFSNAGCNEIMYEDDGEGGGNHYDHQAIANARLIAAAPELAKALSDFLENPAFQVGVGGNPNAVDAMLSAARLALSKARGDT